MVENSIHETPDGSHPDKPATAFTPLLTTHDWNEEWKELQKARRAADDASHWDKRAATFGSKDAPNPYVERFWTWRASGRASRCSTWAAGPERCRCR